MLRLIASTVLALLANALALVVAALVLDEMALDVTGLVIAAFVFTAATVLIEPLLRQLAFKNTPALLGSSTLIATLLGLVVSVVVTDGLTIDGLATWVLATVIVWAIGLVARLLLPLVMFRQILNRSPETQ